MPDDKLTLEFTRQEAFQFLNMYTVLRTVEAMHAPGLCARPDSSMEKIAQLQAFVEGTIQ